MIYVSARTGQGAAWANPARFGDEALVVEDDARIRSDLEEAGGLGHRLIEHRAKRAWFWAEQIPSAAAC